MYLSPETTRLTTYASKPPPPCRRFAPKGPYPTSQGHRDDRCAKTFCPSGTPMGKGVRRSVETTTPVTTPQALPLRATASDIRPRNGVCEIDFCAPSDTLSIRALSQTLHALTLPQSLILKTRTQNHTSATIS
eukprot:GHVR01030524.1.p1 GENE.GHVR01030524.1~~GHVR01030524.1.p1  ORF type:complete len:133 (-),score=15.71 GHVR01030524.1:241-639(-)